MIASQKIGKSFMGALNYNWKKLHGPDPKKRAELLSTNFVSMDLAKIKKEVDILRSFRPALNRYVYHTSLNFSKEEVLDNKKLLDIAQDYLSLSGYNNNQYFIFRHHDADHPHLHLLVNRITFDGDVVSDSNNYKKSEAILRKLELQYNLVAVAQSNHVAVDPYNDVAGYPGSGVTVEPGSHVSAERYNKAPLRAPTKSEVEMVNRTGKASNKMVLQDKVLRLVSQPGLSLQDFINKCEAEDIHLLFNQASTGRVSGITYFYGDFKVKGQALGNRFKWAELIKNLDYDQSRDGEGISQASERTKARYGDFTAAGYTSGGMGIVEKNPAPDATKLQEQSQFNASNTSRAAQPGAAAYDTGTGIDGSAQGLPNSAEVDNDTGRYGDWRDSGVGYIPDIEISDDIDDEAVLGRNRRRQKQARTNQR